MSNTLALERRQGWTGILVEPARCWHAALTRNRGCAIDLRAVWRSSGEILQFNETRVPLLSTLDQFSDRDMHAARRRNGNRYPVVTVSLNNLLEEHSAPAHVDFLSIDTQGSELEILRGCDLVKHRFSVITVEHNWTSDRSAICSLLTGHGYVQRFKHLSEHDDWFVWPSRENQI